MSSSRDRRTVVLRLIDRSSFGTPAARSLRSRTPAAIAASITTELNRRAAWTTTLGDAPKSGARNSPDHSIQALSECGIQSARVSTKEVNMPKSRKTSASAASAASKVLRDGRTSAASKTAAASALSQRAPKRGK